MIQEKKGIASDEAKLVFGIRYLKDGHTLSSYRIRDGAILYLGRMKTCTFAIPVSIQLNVGHHLVQVITDVMRV